MWTKEDYFRSPQGLADLADRDRIINTPTHAGWSNEQQVWASTHGGSLEGFRPATNPATNPAKAGPYWWNNGVAPPQNSWMLDGQQSPAPPVPSRPMVGPGQTYMGLQPRQPNYMARNGYPTQRSPLNLDGMSRFKQFGMPNFGGPGLPGFQFQQQQQPQYPFQLPQMQLGNFYTPTPMGDAQNGASNNTGANFLAPPRRY